MSSNNSELIPLLVRALGDRGRGVGSEGGAARFSKDLSKLVKDSLNNSVVEDPEISGLPVVAALLNATNPSGKIDLQVSRAQHGSGENYYCFEAFNQDIGLLFIDVPVFFDNELGDGKAYTDNTGLNGSNEIRITSPALGSASLAMADEPLVDEFELSSGAYHIDSEELSVSHSLYSRELSDKLLAVFSDPHLLIELHIAAGKAADAFDVITQAGLSKEDLSQELKARLAMSVIFDSDHNSTTTLLDAADDAGFTGLLDYLSPENIHQVAHQASTASNRVDYDLRVMAIAEGAKPESVKQLVVALDLFEDSPLSEATKAELMALALYSKPARSEWARKL